MSLFTWGLGKSGQLGTGHWDNCELPQIVGGLKKKVKASISSDRNELITSVDTGALFTAYLTKTGKLFTFGCGKYGRLGTGDENSICQPVHIEIQDEIFKEISCGSWHAVALTEGGKLYTWGYAKSRSVQGGTDIPLLNGTYSIPRHVEYFNNCRIIGVSCGHNYTLCWDDTGNAFSWGSGHHGVLGHGDSQDKNIPTQITNLTCVVKMCAGHSHSAAISEGGRLFMFGKGKDGALGFGESKLKDLAVPTELCGISDVVGVSCSVGEHHGHTLALTHNGTVYSWGDGYKGKLGLGHQNSVYVPTTLSEESFNSEPVIGVSAGGIHSSAVSQGGHVFTWGCGSDGRLGHPEAKGHRYLFRSDTPRIVEYLALKGKAVAVKASYYHTVAIIQEDTITVHK